MLSFTQTRVCRHTPSLESTAANSENCGPAGAATYHGDPGLVHRTSWGKTPLSSSASPSAVSFWITSASAVLPT